MTTSEAFVWIWLPQNTEPVLCGRLSKNDKRYRFQYARRYLMREDAIPVYLDLPLRRGWREPAAGLVMPASIRDAAPDAWGRRIIEQHHGGRDLDEITYLLESGSDRIGALDFQRSATEYEHRGSPPLSLGEIQEAMRQAEAGRPLPLSWRLALLHGTSVGGARPKMLIEIEGRKWIAKFGLSTDTYPVVKAEYLAMRLAGEAGMNVANVRLEQVGGREVLLVERFDRILSDQGWRRRAMVSALTVLRLDEMMARYASYQTLAEIYRQRGGNVRRDLEELFRRLVFNILVGNNDDHARNHAFFWDGASLSLTPAYDLCPQPRTGGYATQAMRIDGDRRDSRLSLCIQAARHFLLDESQARRIVLDQIDAILSCWDRLVDEAGLKPAEERQLAGRAVLNPAIVEGLESGDPIARKVLAFGAEDTPDHDFDLRPGP